MPLYVTVGGGLTEVASALILEPRIADRFTLVWIGGDALPGGGTGETNFNIDPLAAQYLFNETSVPIWQVPRAVYATCMVSATELQAFVAPYGAIGEWLQEKLFAMTRKFGNKLNTGETWTLGDSPLVLLTALTDWPPSTFRSPLRFERTGSSLFDEVTAPHLNADGTFTSRTEGRKIRVYRNVDSRLMLGDFFAKIKLNFSH
ncbi:MAG TPA: nucleoside hydrolase [Sphingobium sp.]|uniref:nucleoside hydrolase n=1 Tax=Sphingobium sp. TaxID=1912891 RepID=UPI002ED603DA